MPTSTFFNLPPPKRDKLVDAAIAEFACKPYSEVSINRIIQAAEIPRGSFYQYFADKTDLFRYVLQGYTKLLEKVITKGLDQCGGKPLDLPLALFDLIFSYIKKYRDEFSLFLGILQQNAGMDAGHLLNLPDMIRLTMERTDWSGLDLTEQDQQLALLDLLLSSAGQSLMAAACGKLTPEESRRRLALKTAIIRRGAESKEELC